MTPRVLLALAILFYAAFPIGFALLRPALRLVAYYVYVAVVLVVGGFLGAVHGFPLTDDLHVSAGSVAYAALLMSAMLAVIVGHDLRVVRVVALIVVAVNVFKVGLFAILSTALGSARFTNPFGTDAAVFGTSVRSVVAGGSLIVLELLLMLAVFSWLRSLVTDPVVLSTLYLLTYMAVLTLDGVLFPVLGLGLVDDLGEVIERGVQAKAVLAVGFAAPIAVFLVVARGRVAAYQAAPLRLQDLLFASRDDLVRELERRDAALAATEEELARSQARHDERARVSQAVAAIDDRAPVDDKLAAVGEALRRHPGVVVAAVGMVVFGDDEVRWAHGRRIGTLVADEAERRRLASAPWVEHRELGEVVCVPVVDRGELTSVVEVGVRSAAECQRLLPALTDVAGEIAALVRADAEELRQEWARRRPILSLVESRVATPVFQPVVRLGDRTVVGYEGLIRFEADRSPEQRLREAATLGIGVELELLAAERIVEAGRALPVGMRLSINVSAATAVDPRLAALLQGADRPITLELTEHEPVHDYDALIEAVAAMPRVRLAVDDAGSGYASLRHILRVRPAEVKLDMTWVTGIDVDPARQALVGSLVTFAAELGILLTAEGVEREEELAALVRLGVERGQGYLFGRPAAIEAIAALGGG